MGTRNRIRLLERVGGCYNKTTREGRWMSIFTRFCFHGAQYKGFLCKMQ